MRHALPVAAALAALAAEPAAAACEQTVPVLEAGRVTAQVCPEDAPARGLTLIDLSDDWVPALLRGQAYAATYVALANETPGKGHEWDRARQDRYLELYGIPPTPRVVAARLLDDARHICDAAGDVSVFEALRSSIRIGNKSVPVSAEVEAALERRLACDGLLPPSTRPPPRWRLEAALATFQRMHAVVSRGVLDAETRRVLAADSRELDFRALLRVLRARVIDATGLLEDGSALRAPGTVLGRRIDCEALHATSGGPLANGAPDLISPATEIVALALGWTDPSATAARLRRGPLPRTIAVKLPPPPAYHSGQMDLRAEIDRGDVWYDLPGHRGRIETRPTLTLFARAPSGAELALVRWRTTIGGWKKEVGQGGRIGLRFKDSDVGPRVWRDLIATPAWIPPPDTPPRTLVRRVWKNAWIPDTDLVGPGYASAYGLVMLVHHEVVTRGDKTVWVDNGIRTHGTVSYASVLRGESHGCHRLFNQSAVQLASFLLRHRAYERRGPVARPYLRLVHWKGRVLKLRIPNRGFRFELTPPVPVDVLEGTVRGRYHKPPRQFFGTTTTTRRVRRPRPR